MVRSIPGGVFFLLLAIMLSAAGCGKKTMIVPPQTLVPVPVDDLEFSKTDNGVSLGWSFPQKTVAGTRLEQIDGFELLRAESPSEDYCAGCPQSFGQPVEIPGGKLPGDGSGRKASFADNSLRPGYHYVYTVRARSGKWGTSQDSNRVDFEWNPPGFIPARQPRGQTP